MKILVDEPAYGLDTEFMSERTYWPHLCLVQVSWAKGVALVDPLACDVRALEAVLRAPATMITHAGASDLPILDRAIGARPSALFDVQLAAGFVGLGLPSLGTLVSVLLGIRLDKSEQLADWSKRPLSDATRRYAAADVEHLFPLTIELQHRLQDMGRETWAASECEVLRTDRRPARRSRRSRGGRSRARRRCAARRRASRSPSPDGASARAQRLDVLPRFVLPDLALAAVVGRPPKTRDQLFALRGVNRLPNDVVLELLAAVEAGREMPKERLRLPEKYDDGPELDAAVALLVAYVAELARAERVEKQLLATRDDVKALVYGRPSRLDAGWRAQIAGDQLHRLLDGKAVIRLTDRGRHLRLED